MPTAEILMIEPVNFGYNSETAVNNSFQKKSSDTGVQENALKEFKNFVSLLLQNKVHVHVVKDSASPVTPDSLFPNNWISFHDDGSVFLYPMFAQNRREERKQTVIDYIKNSFQVTAIHNLSSFEEEQIFLEGTGSMVLDRKNKIAYAALSPRTNVIVFNKFCSTTKFKPVTFTSRWTDGSPIYHTNVMMCVAETFVVICLESISDQDEKDTLLENFKNTGKEVIEISYEQLGHFAGNMLQIKNMDGEMLLVMSTQAYQSLTEDQISRLLHFNRILHSPLDTIETSGGGSARCMMAEIYNQTA